MTICTFSIEKNQKIIFSPWFTVKNIFLTRLDTKLWTKNAKNDQFWASKDSYFLKIILAYNIWTFICKKMSKT
jgi:hypothetical protein